MRRDARTPSPNARRIPLPRRWREDRGGNIAVMFAIILFAVLGVVGASTDYGRKLSATAKAQGAADAAALAIATNPKTANENLTTAKNVISAHLTGAAGLNIVVTQPASLAYRVTLTYKMPTSLMQVIGFRTMDVAVTSDASAGSGGPVEVALALDNTGSMRNDMPALRAAAADFAKNVFSSGGANVKMSVVPYVAAVNPGANTWPLWMIDSSAKSMWHGYFMTWSWIAIQPNCTPNWMTGGGGGGGGTPGSSSSGDRSDAIDILAPLTRFARSLFGVSHAQAQTTANTIPPLLPDAKSPTSEGFFLPNGFTYDPAATSGDTCAHLVNTAPISNLDLFARMPGTVWKGCVEARPSSNDLLAGGYGSGNPDFDVTDDPPVASNANSLFTPYFWPDESDYQNNVYNAPGPYPPPSGAGYHNNYLADGVSPATWSYDMTDPSGAKIRHDGMQNNTLFKYNGTAPAIIREAGNADTYGPNASCPDPVLRLTSSAAAVDSKINSLSYWTGGGTVISEGLMWAWRSLSPNLPFADGKPYDKANRKVIVLMTDGVNGLADNNIWSNVVSDYSAYNYLGAGRQGPLTPTWAPQFTFDRMTAFLDERTRAACANAKAKGIEIYTVFFNRGTMTAAQQASSRNLLSSCASTPQNLYEAKDATTLQVAFGQVGSAIGKVRLVK
jgi:Flp pilus assembly protein TadG